MKATNKLKMKKLNQGITLVSLVVTIIILIILAGISINLTLGEEGIFTLAQRAKENTELAQIEEQEKLNALYTEFDFNTEGERGTVGNSYDAIQELLEFKRAIIDAIKEADGVITDIGAETKTFQQNIKEIVAEVTKNATATEEDIAEGETAWVQGKEIKGKMKNEGIRLDSDSITVLHNQSWYTQSERTTSYKVTKEDETKYSHLMILYTNGKSVDLPECGGKTLLVEEQDFFYTGNGSIYLIKKPTEGSTFSYTSTSGKEWYKGFMVLGISY